MYIYICVYIHICIHARTHSYSAIHVSIPIFIYTCMYIYIHTYNYNQYTYIYIYIWIKTLVVAGPPSLLQTFVAGPLLQTLVADLCVEYRSLQGACREGVCRRTPPSVTNLCREMAAQVCYKANVFDSLPYIYSHTKQIHGTFWGSGFSASR